MRNDEPAERMKISGVYCIENTITLKRYVGSAVKFSTRLAIHLHRLRKGNHHSRHLQSSWSKHGEETFRFFILEVTDQDSLLDCEQRHIDDLRTADSEHGYNINPTAGSSLGVKRSAETCRNQSARQIGKKHSAEHKAKIAAAEIGRTHSAETKAKIGAAGRRRKATPETLAKMSAANRGKKHTAEHSAKTGAVHRGKPKSAEQRAKMSASQIGRPKPREAVANAAAAKRIRRASRMLVVLV